MSHSLLSAFLRFYPTQRKYGLITFDSRMADCSLLCRRLAPISPASRSFTVPRPQLVQCQISDIDFDDPSSGRYFRNQDGFLLSPWVWGQESVISILYSACN